MTKTTSLVLFGPPGAGKGTQAEKLSHHFTIPQISTGNILRKLRTEDTPLAREVSEVMLRGDLVPASLVVDIVEERLKEKDCGAGFILDGFPRTVEQAKALERILGEQGKQLDAVVSLEVSEKELVARLGGRRLCPACGRAYHLSMNPPKEDERCDTCKKPLFQRDDDREDTILGRLRVYWHETAPLVDYYRHQGLLRPIDGETGPDRVFAQILSVLT